MITPKDLAAEATKYMKTHRLVAMRVNTNNQLCLELANKQIGQPSQMIAITMEGVEEIMKFGFAARSLFP